ncbi:MAG: hypothetical protein V3W06_07965 [Acidimicrobiia bacterium]
MQLQELRLGWVLEQDAIPTPDPPDIDGDGNVGILDFLALLANWGPCP